MKRFGFVFLLLLFLGNVKIMAQAMPPSLPKLRALWHRDTTICDYLFVNTARFQLPMQKSSGAVILNKHAEVVWYFASVDNLYDFLPKENGHLAFNINNEWYEFDSTLTVQPRPTCNSISGDLHELLLLADGRSFELCMADTFMDLSSIQTRSGQNGDTLGQVRYNVIHERDASGTILKTWRGIDHFSISDAETYFFTIPTYLELNHTNSMEYDGRYMLISHRSNHEIDLVDWPTGRMVWRLGGANNQFTFPNGGQFNSQHDARFVGPGKISLFDNATLSSPNHPAAIVFDIDTVNYIATQSLRWEDPIGNSNSMGGFRLLPNGDGVISWGNIYPQNQPNITYFNARKQAVCDLLWEDPHLSYRAVCGELPFEIERPTITCEQQNGNLILRLVGSYPSQKWSNGATDDFIVLQDTGWYQCYVPLGDGFAGSNVFHVTDLAASCPIVNRPEPSISTGKPAKRIGIYDLLGREIQTAKPGNLYIERYDNGQSRKVRQQN